MEDDYWKVLLKNTKYFGLTIPTIIGSKHYLTKNSKLDSIVQLFTKIINDNSNFVLVFQYCPDIGEYVFSIGHQGYLMNGLHIKNHQTNTVKIVFAPNTESFGTNIVEIQNNLGKRYIEKIKNELFSFNKFLRQFERFNRKEIENMRQITIANTV